MIFLLLLNQCNNIYFNERTRILYFKDDKNNEFDLNGYSRSFVGARGETGARGEKGDRGEKSVKGDQGDIGPRDIRENKEKKV